MAVNVLFLNGSLAKNSKHQALFNVLQKQMPQLTFTQFDLATLPLFTMDNEHEAVYEALRDAIRKADAVLIASPEYNSSVTPALKNAIDAASRPYGEHAWKGKKVAVFSCSPSAFGGMNSNQHSRAILQFLGADVFAEGQLQLPHIYEALPEADLVDAKAQQQLQDFAQAFLEFIRD